MSDPSTNPLLAKVKLPGRIFQLPSRGLFYTNGELSDTVTDGEIHVRPMSALAEINMKNPDQLFSGKAVEQVFKECIDGINKPSELLAKDVDAIMMYLRTVTYGAGYEFVARHSCENATDHTYVADIDELIQRIKFLDPTTIDKTYTLVLPNEQVVKLNPNKYSQILDLIRDNQSKTEMTVEDMQRNLLAMLLGVIKSVDGNANYNNIKEWLSTIPTTWTTRIAEKVDGINSWGPQLTWSCKCADCGEEFPVEIPINPVSFFTE
jgi:hypothetical protein